MIDDGTAAEIGAFAELSAAGTATTAASSGSSPTCGSNGARKRPGDGMNLFVIGAIRSAGPVCWSVDEAIAALRAFESP